MKCEWKVPAGQEGPWSLPSQPGSENLFPQCTAEALLLSSSIFCLQRKQSCCLPSLGAEQRPNSALEQCPAARLGWAAPWFVSSLSCCFDITILPRARVMGQALHSRQGEWRKRGWKVLQSSEPVQPLQLPSSFSVAHSGGFVTVFGTGVRSLRVRPVAVRLRRH